MGNDWEFLHVAIVVKDIDRTMAFYKSLGMDVVREPPPVGEERVFGGPNGIWIEVNGKPPVEPLKCRAGLIRKGSFDIELIQPVEGDSIWKRTLEKYGESVEHISFAVDDLPKEKAEMLERGFQVVQAIKRPNGKEGAIWFDCRRAGAVIVELHERVKQ
jgi:catechol 2,3-dioxygenase-like lactoylglutathione lyase family enzyme